MADRNRMFVILFESEQRNIGGEVVTLLDRYVDVESGDCKIDKTKIELRIVLSASLDAVLAMCDEIKKELENSSDERIRYSVATVS